MKQTIREEERLQQEQKRGGTKGRNQIRGRKFREKDQKKV